VIGCDAVATQEQLMLSRPKVAEAIRVWLNRRRRRSRAGSCRNPVEFLLRFTDLDPDALDAVKRALA